MNYHKCAHCGLQIGESKDLPTCSWVYNQYREEKSIVKGADYYFNRVQELNAQLKEARNALEHARAYLEKYYK